MEREARRFAARGSDGRDYTVIMSRISWRRADTGVGRGSDESPSAQFRTSDGAPVNRLKQGHYQIRGTDIILTSEDPDAP